MEDKEFKEMLSDFDGFMRKHVYYTIKDIGAMLGIQEVSVRVRIRYGLHPGSVKLGNKVYIPIDTLNQKL